MTPAGPLLPLLVWAAVLLLSGALVIWPTGRFIEARWPALSTPTVALGLAALFVSWTAAIRVAGPPARRFSTEQMGLKERPDPSFSLGASPLPVRTKSSQQSSCVATLSFTHARRDDGHAQALVSCGNLGPSQICHPQMAVRTFPRCSGGTHMRGGRRSL